eukprot:2812072-Karenia_brevis.AAC.1
MPTWFVWGIQRACSDKAIDGLKELLVHANSIKEQVEKLEAAKKLEEQMALEEFEATRAEFISTTAKIDMDVGPNVGQA